MGIFGFISSIFSALTTWLQSRRDELLRNEGRLDERRKVAEQTAKTVTKREEAINEEPKTSYDGTPSAISEWVRQRNARKD